jgi:hypothetical protein
MRGGKTLSWKAVSYGAGALATVLTRRLLAAAWTGFRDTAPPEQPSDRGISWPQALSWAIATGVGVGVTRLVAVRTAAVVWEATTHEPPPGTESQ